MEFSTDKKLFTVDELSGMEEAGLFQDERVELTLYSIAGVQEYWIEDIQGDQLLVFRNPLEDRYQSALRFHRNQTVSPVAFPDVQFSVDQILG